MAEYSPVYTFPQASHEDFIDSLNHFTIPMPSQQQSQGDRIPVEVSCSKNSYNMDTTDPNTFQSPGTPGLDDIDSLSHFTIPMPSQQHSQGDRIPIKVSCSKNSYNMDTADTNTFQSPGTLGLDDMPTTYSSRRKNFSDHNLSNQSNYHIPFTTDSLTTDCHVRDPAVYDYTDPHRVINTYGPASSATLFSDVNCQGYDDWQNELERADFKTSPIASSFPTDATPFGELEPQTLNNHEDLFSSMTDFSANNIEHTAQPHQGSSLKRKFNGLEPPEGSTESHISTSHPLPPKIYSNWPKPSQDLARKHLVPWEVNPSCLKHQQVYSADRRHPTIITHSHILIPRRDVEYHGPAPSTRKRRRTESASDGVRLSCASPAPDAHDDDLELFAQFTTLVDDKIKETCNGEDTTEPGAKRCCTGSQNPAQRRRRRQPRKTPNANAVPANPESQQKKKRQQQISNRNRRMNPKFRYFCASEDCKESMPREGKGFVTKEDARRHLKIHEPRHFTCIANQHGCERQFHRQEALIS